MHCCLIPKQLGIQQLSDWLASITSGFLQSNPAQTKHSCHAALANSFPINFPDPAIVKLYTQPLVSSIDGIQQLDLTCLVPDIKAIIHQCKTHLKWGSAQDLLQNFEKDILPAVFIHTFINSKGTQNWPNPRSQVIFQTVFLHWNFMDKHNFIAPIYILSSQTPHSQLVWPTSYEVSCNTRFQHRICIYTDVF